MAKKRVHEIAKERGIPSKEVLAKLQAAGFNVKAAASSVDENDIAVAFDGAPRKDAGNGADADAAEAATPAPAAKAAPADNGGDGAGRTAQSARPARSGRPASRPQVVEAAAEADAAAAW